MSVCLSVYLSVFLSVQAMTFELLHKETSFLVCWYVFTISRSSLSIKVIGSRSRSYDKNDSFIYFKVKVTHQGEGHIKVKVKISTFQFYVKFHLFQHINPLCVATIH